MSDEIMASVITGLIKPGAHIILAGQGTTASPYVVGGVPEATDLIKAGENVTFTGTGTSDDPYVISAAGGGGESVITGLIKAGSNVTITGSGTLTDPYVVSAAASLPPRGEPVKLVMNSPAIAVRGLEPAVIRNPDGSISMIGEFQVKGPYEEADQEWFASVPAGYFPDDDFASALAMSFMDLNPGMGMNAVKIDIYGHVGLGGQVMVSLPDAGDGTKITVHLDGVTYWPGA